MQELQGQIEVTELRSIYEHVWAVSLITRLQIDLLDMDCKYIARRINGP